MGGCEGTDRKQGAQKHHIMNTATGATKEDLQTEQNALVR